MGWNRLALEMQSLANRMRKKVPDAPVLKRDVEEGVEMEFSP
jgi:hypothetical protein